MKMNFELTEFEGKDKVFFVEMLPYDRGIRTGDLRACEGI